MNYAMNNQNVSSKGLETSIYQKYFLHIYGNQTNTDSCHRTRKSQFRLKEASTLADSRMPSTTEREFSLLCTKQPTSQMNPRVDWWH
jgi:hypothetical protein